MENILFVDLSDLAWWAVRFIAVVYGYKYRRKLELKDKPCVQLTIQRRLFEEKA